MRLPARGAVDQADKAEYLELVELKRKIPITVQSLFCLVVERVICSDVTQHLPSSLQHHLVALLR